MGEVKPRIGMPIRADGELAAILWLIDDDTVSQAELDDCLHTIHQVETIFERRLVSNLSAELQLEESLAGLLSDTYSDRRAAEEDLSDLGHFAACVGFTALVMRFDRESRGTIEDHEYRLLLRATKRALTPIPAQDRIFGRVNDFFVIVLGFRGAVLTEILQELADRLVKEADVLTPGAEARLHVGAGGRVTALTHVSDSVEQGILSLRAASATGVTTRLWDDPGVDLLLADLLPASLPPSRVPPVLRTIDDSVSPEVLQTVLAYLDHGGNIAKTSEDLFLHRTTAYYRLAKFEKATNLDLGDGRARLMVHLWLLSLPFLRRTEP
ncbi:helix-turn-helix domain-containing protein [Brevibacterium samyangense]